MFSCEQALRLRLDDLHGWRLYLKCRRCERQRVLVIRRSAYPMPRLLGDLLARLRCQGCRRKPDGAMITTDTRPRGTFHWFSEDKKKGPTTVVLWDARNH